MPLLVPSRDCLHFRELAGNADIPIGPHRFIGLFRSVLVLSQTDPTAWLARLLTQRFLIFIISAIHLLGGCD